MFWASNFGTAACSRILRMSKIMMASEEIAKFSQCVAKGAMLQYGPSSERLKAELTRKWFFFCVLLLCE